MSFFEKSPSIHEVQPQELPKLQADLVKITADCVQEGASIGFLKREGPQPIIDWWQELIGQLDETYTRLFVAKSHGKVVGCVLLVRANKPNSRHRAEIQKLLVSPKARRQGIAAALLEVVDQEAKQAGVELLFLDTESSSGAARLYPCAGFTMLGDIPNYAETPDGDRHPTRIFYKELS